MIRVTLDTKECMPFKEHRWDAGFDLRSNNTDFIIQPGEKVKVYTGVKIQIPVRHMGLITPRSGLGSKYEIGLANTVGIIDSEYRGEIIVNLVNKGEEPLEIKQYDRFAQIVIVPIYVTELRAISQLPDSAREDKGFGSSGVE
jgi:dUTP pyrophosphatase